MPPKQSAPAAKEPTEYIYHVFRETNDPYDPYETRNYNELVSSWYTVEKAVAAVKAEIWAEGGADAFDDYEEQGEGENFNLSAVCEGVEVFRVWIDKHEAPPRPAPAQTPAPPVQTPAVQPSAQATLEIVYTLFSKTYDHHTDRVGKEKLVGKVVYTSLLEANQGARRTLIVNLCHRTVPKDGMDPQDWAYGLEAVEKNVDSNDDLYFGEARFVSNKVDTATCEVRPMRVQYPKVTKGKKRASAGSSAGGSGERALKQVRMN
ncbi:hypothetical protein IAR55_007184 [Kwoniella newhampshirensis]|uniref:Uncharacterized protein n=1 Tax=Kwoniella newhampshirensis TaxID=1651941 RepID=A0AAW0YTH4_9TREE